MINENEFDEIYGEEVETITYNIDENNKIEAILIDNFPYFTLEQIKEIAGVSTTDVISLIIQDFLDNSTFSKEKNIKEISLCEEPDESGKGVIKIITYYDTNVVFAVVSSINFKKGMAFDKWDRDYLYSLREQNKEKTDETFDVSNYDTGFENAEDELKIHLYESLINAMNGNKDSYKKICSFLNGLAETYGFNDVAV